MNIWLENGYIFIKVNKHFTYDVCISKIKTLGTEKDAPSTLSMWGWINHFRDKNWWNKKTEDSFIKFCSELINK